MLTKICRRKTEKIYEATNQICHKKKKPPDVKGVYGNLIKVDLLVNMNLEASEGTNRTLEMEIKIVNKKFNDTFFSSTVKKKFLK